MSTELELTSYRNAYDLINELVSTLTNINNQTKLTLARSALGSDVIISINTDEALIGYAISLSQKHGDRSEWWRVVKDKVLGGMEPLTFVTKAYVKSTGDSTPQASRILLLNGLQSNYTSVTFKLSGVMNYDPRGGIALEEMTRWVLGQDRRLVFMFNDLFIISTNLQLELARLRIPMPENFRLWLQEMRDDALVESGYGARAIIKMMRIWELTLFTGELAGDINTMKAFIDKQIAAIESAPVVPVEVTAPAEVIAPLVSEPVALPAFTPSYVPEETYFDPTRTAYARIEETAPVEDDVYFEELSPTSETIEQEVIAEAPKKLPAWVLPTASVLSFLAFRG